MFDTFNNCLIVVRYGFNLVFVVRMVLDVRLNWLYDVKKVQRHPIRFQQKYIQLTSDRFPTNIYLKLNYLNNLVQYLAIYKTSHF